MNHQFFIEAQSSREILRQLIAKEKSSNKNFSLSLICKKARIPSRGYFSDVLAGRRILSEKYVEPVCEIFKLETLQYRMVKALVQAERMNKKTSTTNSSQEVRQLKKLLSSMVKPFPNGDMRLALKILTIMPELNSPILDSDLMKHFPNTNAEEIHHAMEQLVHSKLITKLNNEYTLVSTKSSLFKTPDDHDSHLKFAEKALDESKQALRESVVGTAHASFHFFICAVNKETFERKLKEFMADFLVLEDKLTDDHGKHLININLQIHPSKV